MIRHDKSQPFLFYLSPYTPFTVMMLERTVAESVNVPLEQCRVRAQQLADTETIPVKEPSRTRKSPSGRKTWSRSPLEQINESCGEPEPTSLFFHITTTEQEERNPEDHILRLMTLQAEEQRREFAADSDLST